jgi:hypothetical protein
MTKQEKIRPPNAESNRTPAAALKLDDDLPETAQAPDIGGRQAVDDDAVSASADAPTTLVPNDWPDVPPGADPTFSPVQAAAHRAGHGQQNRLGKPYHPTEAERLLMDYQQKLAAFKADYQGTRSTRLEVPMLEAKQRLIDAGLLKGDV